MRTRRPALKMDSTGGVRLRLASTIHSKFVFSRNRPGGRRLPDRFPERAPTCNTRDRSRCTSQPQSRTLGRLLCKEHREPRRVTTVSKINVHAKYDAGGRHMCALPSAFQWSRAGGDAIISRKPSTTVTSRGVAELYIVPFSRSGSLSVH